MVISTVRPSGKLDQIARMELDSSGRELTSKAVYLHLFYKDKPNILRAVKPRCREGIPSRDQAKRPSLTTATTELT